MTKQRTARRAVLVLAVAALTTPLAIGQARVPRIGILSGLPRDKSLFTPLILKALASRGYREGQSMSLEFRSADGDVRRYPALARELAQARCDVIIGIASVHVGKALKEATASTPIVVLASEYDPVETGVVKSFARPGGNVTGVFAPARTLLAKNLEIAREILPGAVRFLVLSDPVARDQLFELRKVASRVGATLTIIEFETTPYDLAGAFERGRKANVQAVIVPLSPIFATSRPELARLSVENRLASFGPSFMVADAGSLVSYGVDFDRVVNRGIAVAERILKGAAPGDIPIEQVDEFRLVINLRTAKALGLKVPYSVLARATAVIE